MIKTFSPTQDDSNSLLAGVTSSRVALDPLSSVVRVVNDGTATAFIQFGDSNVTATLAKMPVRGGATETFSKGTATHMAAIVASGTTQLYVTAGEGL